MAERFKKLKADGVCVICGTAPAKLGRTRCAECARVDALKQQLRYYQNKRDNKCAHCGKEFKKSSLHVICPICRARQRKYLGGQANENNHTGESGNQEKLF